MKGREINNKVFQETLAEHKKLIASVGRAGEDQIDGVMNKVNTTCEKLSLFYAGFQCQKPECKEKEKLTIHHLIRRTNRSLIGDDVKYVTARHYWNSTIILCPEHHNMEDGRKPDCELTCFSKKTILKYKEEFGWVDELNEEDSFLEKYPSIKHKMKKSSDGKYSATLTQEDIEKALIDRQDMLKIWETMEEELLKVVGEKLAIYSAGLKQPFRKHLLPIIQKAREKVGI